MCEVCVVHHDQRGFPSKLKGHSLQVGSANRLLDDMANFSGACEGHLVHVHVLGNGRSSCWSIPWNHVDHPWGEASRLLDDMANFSGACEGHLVHVHVLGNGRSSC